MATAAIAAAGEAKIRPYMPTVDLPVEGDAVLIDLTPHELARVEVTME